MIRIYKTKDGKRQVRVYLVDFGSDIDQEVLKRNEIKHYGSVEIGDHCLVVVRNGQVFKIYPGTYIVWDGTNVTTMTLSELEAAYDFLRDA